MEKTQIILFDLENILFSAKNHVKKLCQQKQLAWKYNAPTASFVRPVIETILPLINNFSWKNAKLHVVLCERLHWLADGWPGFPFEYARESPYSQIKNQAADRVIKDFLYQIFYDDPRKTEVVLCSGDGGFQAALERLYDRGFALQVLGVLWTMNSRYQTIFSEQLVQVLGNKWLNEVCTQTIKYPESNYSLYSHYQFGT